VGGGTLLDPTTVDSANDDKGDATVDKFQDRTLLNPAVATFSVS
jgi:hypothetical protein